MSTRVYVGRITREVRERDLEKFFGTIGEVRSVTIKNGFSFVEFRDYRDAEDAVHDLNNKEFFGERIVCELARGERRRMNARDKYGPMQRTQYRCIVENLAPTVSWQDLKDFMRKAGEVTYADCHKEHEGEGVVEFSSSSDLREALRRLDDQDLKGRRVTLREDTSLRDRLDRDGGRSGSDRGDHHERDRGDRRDHRDHRESRRRSLSPRGARGGSPGRRSRSPVRRRSRSPRRTNGGDRRRSPSPRRRGGSPDREMPRRRGDSPGPDMDVMRDRPQED